MYEQHYHFTEKPFGLTPDPKYLYASHSHAKALATLQQAIARRECFAVVTGDVGTGKTTLCRALVDQSDRKAVVVAENARPEPARQSAAADFGR